jgi:uncharacterized damage-inducible protein DinB
MPRTSAQSDGDSAHPFLETFLVNDRMNQMILECLDPKAWRAKPPGRNVRTIAAIVSHMHNVRRKWLRLSAPHRILPEELDRSSCTQKQARVALSKSAHGCAEMLAEISGDSSKRFRRDGWAKPWPGGAAMLAYMITHEAHHRGQICMLAHQLGYSLPRRTAYQMWSWEKLWKECGFRQHR